jgi:myosin-1
MKSMTYRKYEFNAALVETVESPLNAEQISHCRDALAKDLYERTFNWIIKKINISLEVH